MRHGRWKDRRRKSNNKRVSSRLGNAFNLVIRTTPTIPARKSNHRLRMLGIFSPIPFFTIRKSTPMNWRTFLQHRARPQRINPSIGSTITIMWSTMIIVILAANCTGRWFHVILARPRFISSVLIHRSREKTSQKDPISVRTVELKQQKKRKYSVNRWNLCRANQKLKSLSTDSRNTQHAIQLSSWSNYRQVIYCLFRRPSISRARTNSFEVS